jgi:hypothetical protein
MTWGLSSETLGPDEHGHEVEEESERGDGRECEVERHGRASRIVAQAGISERQCRQPGQDADEHYVLHVFSPPIGRADDGTRGR